MADALPPHPSPKDGTFTNTERRVQRIRKAIEPVGESKADWEIIMKIMNLMGYDKTYCCPAEIMEEITELRLPTPALTTEAGGTGQPAGHARQRTIRVHPTCIRTSSQGVGLFKPVHCTSEGLPDESIRCFLQPAGCCTITTPGPTKEG